MMQEFFKRNKPVFTIGIVTLIVFITLIAISRFKTHKETNLKEITESELLNETEESTESENVLSEEQMDAETGILEIEYGENGFLPKNIKALKGQLVRWINKTNEDIYIQQLMKVYDDFNEPKKIPAGGILEFRLTKDRLWTYQEKDSKSFGSIFVLDVELR